jgi:hypothetical protein
MVSMGRVMVVVQESSKDWNRLRAILRPHPGNDDGGVSGEHAGKECCLQLA